MAQDDREKTSEKLGRMALFKGASVLTRLPPYLNVQLVRFYYKTDTRSKAKVLRKVAGGLGGWVRVGLGWGGGWVGMGQGMGHAHTHTHGG